MWLVYRQCTSQRQIPSITQLVSRFAPSQPFKVRRCNFWIRKWRTLTPTGEYSWAVKQCTQRFWRCSLPGSGVTTCLCHDSYSHFMTWLLSRLCYILSFTPTHIPQLSPAATKASVWQKLHSLAFKTTKRYSEKWQGQVPCGPKHLTDLTRWGWMTTSVTESQGCGCSANKWSFLALR